MKRRLPMSFLAIMLTACGGGGDNAGTCFGGSEVCGLTSAAPPAASVPATPAIDLRSLNCDDVLRIAGGSEPAAYILAQEYYAQGATQLDSSDADPDACEQFK